MPATNPPDADLYQPVYSIDLLANALNQTPSRPLLRQLDGPTLTVGEIRDATSCYIQALASLGVGRAKRVGLLSGNRPEVLHTTHAVQLMAGIYVPMHALGSLDDHLHIVMDAEIEILVFDAKGFGPHAQELARRVPALKLASFGPCEGAVDLDALARSMRPGPLVAAKVTADEVVRIGYSGGTTGKSKSIAGTHGISTTAMSIVMAEWEWPSPPHVLCAAPLSHAGATLVLPALLRGGTMLVLPRFEPVAVMGAIQEHRLNCTLMVPTMIYALLDHPRFDEFDLSSLESVFYGGSSISATRLKEAIERVGPVFSQFYGQAEAPMAVTLLRKSEHDVSNMQQLASCGRPLPWNHVELLDNDNLPVAVGEPGEICVRGPLVMTGYRNNPELTADTFAGGWLHTGDVAVRDANGFLRIVDRKKDMIVSGGFNIFPRELENILEAHPAVAQAAVFGLPDPKWGEAVTAAIVRRPGQDVPAEDLRALIAKRKGSYQAPKRILFVEAIPQTPVGKPDKKALREAFS
jgi:fatty-acyl-CoA synthase